MPYHESANSRFYYRHWDAEAPRAAVLLLHGFGEHSGHYHRFAAALVHAGCSVWALDHVGHGLTGGTPGHFESVEQLVEHAQALAGRIREYHADLPLIVCGHSLGGITAARLGLALQPAPAGLVLTGTPFEGLPALDPALALVMSRDPAYLDDLAHDPLRFDTGPAEANLWRAIDQQTDALRAGLAALQLPVLLINGEHDAFASPALARRWAQTMAQAVAIEIPGGYHDIPNDVGHRQVLAHIVEAIEHWLPEATARTA